MTNQSPALCRVTDEQNQRNADEIRQQLLTENTKPVFSWERSTDDHPYRELIQEAKLPLEERFPREFQSYLDLFFTFQPKDRYHIKRSYQTGFIAQKKKYKHKEGEYFRRCLPGMVARMLDQDRWAAQKPDFEPDWKQPYYWIALRAPKRTKFSRLDYDNKDNLLGFFCPGVKDTNPLRPITTMTLEHFRRMRRIYDAFPNRVWCVSSATLGLHVWAKHPNLQAIEMLHRDKPELEGLFGPGDRATLRKIGLGKTEIHPMQGWPCRLPFGQDYFTISEDGLLDDWIDQLNFFEHQFRTPSFEAVYRGLRELLHREWGKAKAGQQLDWQGKPFNDFRKLKKDSPDLYQRYVIADYAVNINQLKADFGKIDDWAQKGFPDTLPTTIAVPEPPVLIQREPKEGIAHAAAEGRQRGPVAPSEDQEIKAAVKELSLSQVCNRQWVQSCERWAREGHLDHDSILLVVSQLARWFYFIEFWNVPETQRRNRIIVLLQDFCFSKNNGFISRLQAGLHDEVAEHVARIINIAIDETDNEGKLHFAKVRQKRSSGKYRRLIFLESLLAEKSISLSSPSPSVGFTLCCSDFDIPKTASKRRENAEAWNYEPDETPLPEEMLAHIKAHYRRKKKRLFKTTVLKLTRFINHVHASGGECRLGIEGLKRMGFSDHNARQHINEHLERLRIIDLGGYCPAEGISKRFILTKKAREMLRGRESHQKRA